MNTAPLRRRLEPVWGPLQVAASEPWVILAGEPTDQRGWCSYSTAGLSEVAAVGVELVAYGPPDEPWPVELLAEVAGFGAAFGLQAYQALSLGRGLPCEDSPLTGVLLLPPYFEPAAVTTGAPALWWVVPCTTSEVEWAVLAGGRALEAAMFEADLGPVPSPHRLPVV